MSIEVKVENHHLVCTGGPVPDIDLCDACPPQVYVALLTRKLSDAAAKLPPETKADHPTVQAVMEEMFKKCSAETAEFVARAFLGWPQP